MAVVGIFAMSAAHADTTYTTSKGAVFTQMQGPGGFGKAWKDPSGTIWSAYQGDYANNAIKPDQNNVVVDSPATEACAKIGGSLPTAQQYEKLASYFDLDSNNNLTDQGRKDLYAIFPDMQNRWFWSSSVYSSDPDFANAFLGNYGRVDDNYGLRLSYGFSVQCVAE